MTKGQIDNKKRFKAIQDQAKKLKAKNPRLTHLEAVKQAWAMASPVKKTFKAKPIKKTKISGNLSLTKKETRLGYVKAKPAVKKPVSSHKDTASHNVKIKVVSGVKNTIGALNKMQQDLLKDAYQLKAVHEANIVILQALKKKKEKPASYYNDRIKYDKEKISIYTSRIKYLKKNI